MRSLTIINGKIRFLNYPYCDCWHISDYYNCLLYTSTEGSYTTYLFEKGKEKILKKVGEECTEVIIAGEKEDKEETVYEISDLAYHVLVLMVSAGITVEDVTRELEKRHVIDHKVCLLYTSRCV